MRYNTPIAPASAREPRGFVVISLLSELPQELDDSPSPQRLAAYQSPVFLIGRCSRAALDPLNYDLQILDRSPGIATLEVATHPEG